MNYPVNITLYSKNVIYNGFPASNEVPIPEATVENYLGTLSINEKQLKLDFKSEKLYDGLSEHTVVIIEGDTVLISKKINYELNMVFREKDVCECVYLDAYRQMNIRIHTSKLENSLTKDGGVLNIDYTVEILGSIAEENCLSFAVSSVN